MEAAWAQMQAAAATLRATVQFVSFAVVTLPDKAFQDSPRDFRLAESRWTRHTDRIALSTPRFLPWESRDDADRMIVPSMAQDPYRIACSCSFFLPGARLHRCSAYPSSPVTG